MKLFILVYQIQNSPDNDNMLIFPKSICSGTIYFHFNIYYIHYDKAFRYLSPKENLSGREGQTDDAPVDKYYYFIWTTKGVRCFPKLNYKRPREGPHI